MLREITEKSRDPYEGNLEKYLSDIVKHVKEIEKINEKMKRELGAYKTLKESLKEIIWTTEIIRDSQ